MRNNSYEKAAVLMKLILEGRSGAGKSTLANKLLCLTDRPIFGFYTKKYASFDAIPPVYLHPIGFPPEFSEENRIGACRNETPEKRPEVFDRFGVAVLSQPPEGALLVMDELGIMENEAFLFQTCVLALLREDRDFLVCLRDKHTPFLDAVRGIQGAASIYITAQTRLAAEQAAFLDWIKWAGWNKQPFPSSNNTGGV